MRGNFGPWDLKISSSCNLWSEYLHGGFFPFKLNITYNINISQERTEVNNSKVLNVSWQKHSADEKAIILTGLRNEKKMVSAPSKHFQHTVIIMLILLLFGVNQ